jgi:hypothetical protein
MNLLISEVIILSLYSESGISNIFLICSRNSLAFLSCSVNFFSSVAFAFFSSDFFSGLFHFLDHSSVQKTASNIESIQLFFFFKLPHPVLFQETSAPAISWLLLIPTLQFSEFCGEIEELLACCVCSFISFDGFFEFNGQKSKSKNQSFFENVWSIKPPSGMMLV